MKTKTDITQLFEIEDSILYVGIYGDAFKFLTFNKDKDSVFGMEDSIIHDQKHNYLLHGNAKFSLNNTQAC